MAHHRAVCPTRFKTPSSQSEDLVISKIDPKRQRGQSYDQEYEQHVGQYYHDQRIDEPAPTSLRISAMRRAVSESDSKALASRPERKPLPPRPAKPAGTGDRRPGSGTGSRRRPCGWRAVRPTWRASGHVSPQRRQSVLQRDAARTSAAISSLSAIKSSIVDMVQSNGLLRGNVWELMLTRVILSAAKDLPQWDAPARFFAALRMTQPNFSHIST